MDTPDYTSNSKRKCIQCGLPISHRGNGNFCSRECYWNSMKTPVERVCEICNQVFTVTPTRIKPGQALFCSRKCRGISLKQSRVKCECVYCGMIFEKHPSDIKRGSGKYCSNHCAVAARIKPKQYKRRFKVNLKCEYCGIIFKAKPIDIDRRGVRFCSRKCSGLAHRGKNSATWRGGHSKYRGDNWVQQRKLAYNRDKGVCQYCGRQPKQGVKKCAVHHIKPFREFDGDYIAANQLTNLITLCHPCHMRAESGNIPIQPYLF